MAGRAHTGAGRVALALLAAAALLTAALLAFAAPAEAANPGPKVAPGVFLGDSSDLPVKRDRGMRQPDAAQREPRIVNGRPVDISQVPWQVAVTVSPALFPGNAAERQFCGGSLVRPNLVITAAHCIYNRRGTAFEFPAEALNVVTGRTVLSSNQGEEIQVSDFKPFLDGSGNPLYNPRNGAWDVAVLVLDEPSFAGGLIQIPGPDETALWTYGRPVLVSGWGHTREGGEASDRLLAADLLMLRDDHCADVPGGAFHARTSVCAGLLSGRRDSCQGDSGGPLVAFTADGGARLIGDVQSGVGCARQLSPGSYGRFGENPVQTALRNASIQLTGSDIQGSGGTPILTMDREQALELTFGRAKDTCDERRRRCRGFSARRCRPRGDGFVCQARNRIVRRNGRKRTCTEKMLWTSTADGVVGDRQGRRRCR